MSAVATILWIISALKNHAPSPPQKQKHTHLIANLCERERLPTLSLTEVRES